MILDKQIKILINSYFIGLNYGLCLFFYVNEVSRTSGFFFCKIFQNIYLFKVVFENNCRWPLMQFSVANPPGTSHES
jgi:hypothetical protein